MQYANVVGLSACMQGIPWYNRDPRSWYQLERWRKRRRVQLRMHPVCAMCAQRGWAVPATIADHIKPHRGDWSAFLTGELQSLCKPCHDSDKRFIELNGYARIAFGVDGWPLKEEGVNDRSLRNNTCI